MRTLLCHLLLGCLGLLALGPLAWMTAKAVGVGTEVSAMAGLRRLFEAESFGAWMVNSLFICSVQTLAAVLMCSLGGFALWAYRFPLRRSLMVLLALTMLVPSQVTLTGLYELTIVLGGIDQFWAVIAPGAVSAFGVFLYMVSFRSVPPSMLEAARLDGCPEWRLWWSIALPVVRPTTGAFTLLSFLGAWNSLLWPAVVLVSEQKHTLPIGLAGMSGQASYEAEPATLMTATLLSILPVIALFLLCQRDFVRGLASGSGR